MAEAYIGEIRMFAFEYAPRGWALCSGQILPINQNQALYALLGTTYGGNGTTTFALPDLRGRVPVHMGDGITIGEAAGEETHTLKVQEMPAHTHIVHGHGQEGNVLQVENNQWAVTTQGEDNFTTTESNSTMSEHAISSTGSSQAHSNMQPYLVGNYCISLNGVFPSRDY